MSLLEKAKRGNEKDKSQKGSSLFAKALSARRPGAPEPVPMHPLAPELPAAEEPDTSPPAPEQITEILQSPEEPTESLPAPEPQALAEEPSPAFELIGAAGLRLSLEDLPAGPESMLAVWALIAGIPGLDSLALYLAGDGFFLPAACKGFPSQGNEGIPLSLAPSLITGGSALSPELASLVAPALGVDPSTRLWVSLLSRGSLPLGLWAYQAAGLESSPAAVQTELCELLASSSARLPDLPMAGAGKEATRTLLEACEKFSSASIFLFDLAPLCAGIEKAPALLGIKPQALRSIFIAGCERILSTAGLSLAIGEGGVCCIFGSASKVDPALALFQFRKTLKRLLPTLSSAAFPEGRAIRLDPSSPTALEELSAFLSE